MRETRPGIPHLPALDGLRGLAVLAVLLFHAGHLRGGWLGVDLFFVLSGFLITSLLLAEHEATGHISLARFWERRARRLLPALFALLLGVALYAVFVTDPAPRAQIRADAVATLLYVANWHAMLADHDYWEIFRSPAPLAHTWSLAIEEQFYLLWPPLVLLALAGAKASHRTLAAVAAVLAGGSAAWMLACYDPAQGTARVYYGTDTRVGTILVGGVAACLLRPTLRAWPGARALSGAGGGRGRVGDVTALAALGLLCAASFHLRGSEGFLYRGGLFALALACGVVVFGLVRAPGGATARLLRVHPLRQLGLVSYGAYLWHWPIYLTLSPQATGWSGWPLTSLRIGITLAVATLSYQALERPIRRGDAVARRPLLTAFAASGVTLACVGLATQAPTFAGPVRRPPMQAQSAWTVPADSWDVLLVGDSVAFELQEAFVAEAGRRGYRAAGLGSEGCGALRCTAMRFLSGREFDMRPCLRLRAHWEQAVASVRPRHVVLLEGWSGEGEKQVAGRWGHPCQPEFDRVYAAHLSELVETFRRSGARTVLASMPPPVAADLAPAFSRHWGGMAEGELDALFRERMACQNRVRAEVAQRAGASLLDLGSALCATGACLREIDGLPVRSDGMHFKGPGAAWVSRWILDRIP